MLGMLAWEIDFNWSLTPIVYDCLSRRQRQYQPRRWSRWVGVSDQLMPAPRVISQNRAEYERNC